MSSRRLTSLLAVVAATAIVAVPAAAAAATAAPLASDGNGNTGMYLCVNSYLPAQCADLLNNDPVQGQHIIMDSSTLGLGLGWNEAFQGYNVSETAPFNLGSGLNARYDGDGVYEIEKTTPGGHNGCMGVTGAAWDVVWEPCGGDASVLWVLTGDEYLININITNAENNNQPWGLSDQVNGASNGSELDVSDIDNPWYSITP
jgi:opacity protein-like surface antigen